jgi:hypothetical protein
VYKLALALLMLRILLADDAHAALSADHGTIAADFFDGRANFHGFLFTAVRERVSSETVDDAAFGQVVGRHFDFDAIARQEPDTVHTHFPRKVSQDTVPAFEFDLEGRRWKKFFNDASGFDEILPHSPCSVILHSARQATSFTNDSGGN